MAPTVPAEVEEWLRAEGHGTAVRARQVAGGCINNGARLETETGSSFFLKSNAGAPAGMFEQEAEGLRALAETRTLRVPLPLIAGPSFLLLEDLRPAGRAPSFWADLGRGLAALHAHTSPTFGFDHDNFLGSTPQPNAATEDGYEFFAEQRLLYQVGLAQVRGLLTPEEASQVHSIARGLPELVPEQPAALVHGDLWSGNVIAGPSGEPAVIDPAVHYGWAEAELGMTTLFGGFGEDFYRAYEEVQPLQPGWRERLPIYNLYHLLNHLNLFGIGYIGQVRHVLARFS